MKPTTTIENATAPVPASGDRRRANAHDHARSAAAAGMAATAATKPKMRIKADNQTALAGSPTHFILNDPNSGGTPARDLAEYHRWRRRIDYAPDFPAKATLGEAYADVLQLLKGADMALGISLATWATFFADKRDTQSVHALLTLPRPKLIARLLRVGRKLAAYDSDRKGAAKVQESLAESGKIALGLEKTRALQMDQHASKPGSVSLSGLCRLTTLTRFLTCSFFEGFMPPGELLALFHQTLAEVPGYRFCHEDYMPINPHVPQDTPQVAATPRSGTVLPPGRT